MSTSQLLVVFAIIGMGLLWFVTLAQREPRDWHLKSFFLGGGKIGPELTEHNTVGITFAWAGGIFFFALAAYQSGPWVMVLQLAWCFSIVMLALLLPRIIAAIHGRTIHGFLAERYGVVAQTVAAFATTTGYVINAGYEFFFSSFMLASAFGRPALLLPMALGFAAIAGVYCSIGGYRSNARTDKPQNLVGVGALAAIVAFLMFESDLPLGVRIAGWGFVAGSMIYIAVSSLHWRRHTLPSRFLTRIAITFAVAGFSLLAAMYSGSGNEDAGVVLMNAMPIHLLVGVLSFQLFFNIVDMQNWQQIAANEDLPKESRRELRWSIIRASLYLYWFPALGGVLIGVIMRSHSVALDHNTLFSSVFSLVLPAAPELVRAGVIGLIAFGLISTSLSTFDSLLMSAVQTIRYDLFGRKAVERIRSAGDAAADEERRFVMNSRLLLVPLALGMVLLFYWMYRTYEGGILNFQAVMYAAPLMLIVPVLVALFAPVEVAARHKTAVAISLPIALCALGTMLIVSNINGSPSTLKDWLPNLMPAVSLAIPLIGFTISMAIHAFLLPAAQRGH